MSSREEPPGERDQAPNEEQALTAADVGRGFQPPSSPNPKEERESQTARTIAITLLVMLGVTFLADVGSVIVLTVYNRLDAAPFFERMFSAWLPLLSGLVGTAITFYLTRGRK